MEGPKRLDKVHRGVGCGDDCLDEEQFYNDCG